MSRWRGGTTQISDELLKHKQQERERKRQETAKFLGPAPRGKKTKTIGDTAFMRTLEQVADMLKSGKWKEAEGKHFVALYADLYFRVYGVMPGDLGPKERVYATKTAGLLLQRSFGGDPEAMAKFLAWTWTREKEREQWRRENSRDGGIIDWRLQFSGKLVSSYRIAEARKAAHR
jgi:hypothetical protein